MILTIAFSCLVTSFSLTFWARNCDARCSDRSFAARRRACRRSHESCLGAGHWESKCARQRSSASLDAACSRLAVSCSARNHEAPSPCPLHPSALDPMWGRVPSTVTGLPGLEPRTRLPSGGRPKVRHPSDVDGRAEGRAAPSDANRRAEGRAAPSDVDGRPKFEPPKLDGRVPETEVGRRLLLPAVLSPCVDPMPKPVGHPSAPTVGTARASSSSGEMLPSTASVDAGTSKNGHDSARIDPVSTGAARDGLRLRVLPGVGPR